jgi:hypothetical protein
MSPNRGLASNKPCSIFCTFATPRPRIQSKPTLHRETCTESSLNHSGCMEAARGIEALRVRVADDVQDARGALARDVGAMFDQQSPHASLPECRLDEQRIELGIPVQPRQYRCEADDHALSLRHEHVTIRNLLNRKSDDIRIRE